MAKTKAKGRRYQGTSAVILPTGCPDAMKSARAVSMTSGGRQTAARYHRIPTRHRIIRLPSDVTPFFPATAQERITADTAGPNVPQNTRIIGSIPSWGLENTHATGIQNAHEKRYAITENAATGCVRITALRENVIDQDFPERVFQDLDFAGHGKI